MTVAEALRSAERRLRDAGVATPTLDAELLLRHVCRWDRARLLVSEREPLPAEAEAAFGRLVAERAARRPLQHLTGRQAFWRHDFRVTPAVLVPRPETEGLVEAALARLADVRSPVVADVGTGSGCIAISIAAERPDARVIAIDVSDAALAVARENAAHIGVADHLELRRGDLLSPAAPERGRLHMIVSNPPYVDPSERETLAPEVRDHEPALALFAPDDRYSVYRRLVPAAHAHLARGGWLLLEVGAGMADETARLCLAVGFEAPIVRPDLQGIPRIVAARRT